LCRSCNVAKGSKLPGWVSETERQYRLCL
jgi:hypothetical protein